MDWRTQEQLHQALEQAFNTIFDQQMRETALVNSQLSVKALGFSRFKQDWFGIMITPWFMNLLQLPDHAADRSDWIPGKQYRQQFPVGELDFTFAHSQDLGCYAQCSLFSPMFEFANQEAAIAVAEQCLQLLFIPPSSKSLTRRGLLTMGHASEP